MEIVLTVIKILGVLIALVFLVFIYAINQKNILLSYEMDEFHSLNSNDWMFTMTIQNTNIFGVKRIRKARQGIPHYCDFNATIKKWDSLIGKEIK